MRTSTGTCITAPRLPIWLVSLVSAAAFGQEPTAESVAQIEEIIVTAQKREQSADTVGMSITAATGDVLLERGITSVAELARLVPGLTIQESGFNSTSFTLRGVGFFNSDLSTTPAVTVYVDESPLSYPAMTRLAGFDLARVEVLKGPQGTLYGQNATGGAVNYVAAKPGETFDAGMNATDGRFDRIQVGGFVSGPIGETVRTRLAVQSRRGDPWQESVTRPGDRLGRIRELQGRATLEWRPTQRFTSRLTYTSTRDESDSVAAQFLASVPTISALTAPGVATFPAVSQPRAADWTPARSDTTASFPYASDTTLHQASWRVDYSLEDDVTLTSLTSDARFRMGYGQDSDGTPFHFNEVVDARGSIDSFFQELRVAGRTGRLGWLAGANLTHDDVTDEPLNFFRDVDVCHLFESIDPEAFCDKGLYTGHMRADTYAAFGRVEYQVNEQLMVAGGLRFNDDRREFDNCAITVSDHFARYWNIFRAGAQPPTRIGDCFVLDPANSLRPVDVVHSELSDDTVSWSAGLNWTTRTGRLLYATVSKGYKAGTVPVVGASTVTQFNPVGRESLLAYEVGLKSALLDRRAQLNAAAFYYDYDDKQLRGSLLDPTFGPLEALVSIPKSHVAGIEAQLVLRPAERLTLDTSVVYVKTKIAEFTGFDALARFGDQSGTSFPFSPEWQSITNIDYAFAPTRGRTWFVGGSLTYNGKTYAGVGAIDILRIDAFTLLDLRAGVELGNGRYRVWAWGKNVADEYYWNNVLPYGSVISRFVGQPASYGASLSARF